MNPLDTRRLRDWALGMARQVATLSKDPMLELERTGVHHNALDDAKSQALHLITIWREAVGR